MAEQNTMLEALVRAEQAALRNFCAAVPFPSYTKCLSILSRDAELLAEYGPLNHELLKEVYDAGFADKALIRECGRLIHHRGGEQALWANSYAVNRIMVHLTSMHPDRVATETVRDATGALISSIPPAVAICQVNNTHLVPEWEKSLR